METINITIAKQTKRCIRSIEFKVGSPCELRLLGADGNSFEFECTGPDLFTCLCTLRSEYLEIKGCQILCKGARIDTYPSRMSRQMGGGRKAYITRLGHQARMNDLVDIFDSVDDPKNISTVSEQIEFHRNWLESL